MYKILLVDDEFPARQMIRELIDWSKTGFTIAYEADNGRIALDMYRQYKPDLIITDIQMPVMDGLELLSTIRETDKDQLFIAFSCYERFSYARKIIQLGGIDYILKDTLSADALLMVLEDVRKKLSSVPKSDVPPYSMTQPADSDREILFSRIIQGKAYDSEEIAKLSGVLGEQNMSYFIMEVQSDKSELNHHLLAVSLGSIRPLCCDVYGSLIDDEIILLILLKSEADPTCRTHIVYSLQTALENIGVTTTIGVSQNSNVLSDIASKCREARHALEYSIFFGFGKVHYFDTFMDMTYYVQRRQLHTSLSNVRNAIEENSFSQLSFELGQLYRQNMFGLQQYHYLNYLNRELWCILTMTCMMRQKFIPRDTIFQEICKLNSPEDMHKEMEKLFSDMCFSEPNNSFSRRVCEIISYIHDHYFEDISLDNISEHFASHKTNIARQFKAETGLSINEFIRHYRIETSKALLRDSDLRIYEVSYRTGFNTTQSFYNAFIKYVGVPPKLYKDQFLNTKT